MRTESLTFRLLAASTVWVLVSVVAAGLLLVMLFRDHIERRFDRTLNDHLEELVAASEISGDGRLELTWTPADPRFNRPRSGWYWQIGEGARVNARSDSLWTDALPTAAHETNGGTYIGKLIGPAGEPLRALIRRITLPGAQRAFTFAVAGPVGDVHRDVRLFTAQLAATLGVLALGLLAGAVFQIRFGLRPLRTVQRALSEIRAGRAHRLPETSPMELRPLASELNALLEHHAVMLERARTQAANLAHALKNPLAVIRNEAREVTGERGRLLLDQSMRINEQIDRYLARARAAGAAGLLGGPVRLSDTIEDLWFSMDKIYGNRELRITVQGADERYFQGDARDLEEMVGNLLDNACKWAQSEVRITVEKHGSRLSILIDDDGPGIPEDRRAEVMRRGTRLDESVPGSGLGLDVSRELAALYHGNLTIRDSPLGGARAELELPAAD